MQNKLEPTISNPKYPTDAQFVKYPYILNAYIAAYRGYMELERLAGYISDISESAKWDEYNRLLDLRVDNFSKDSYLMDDSFSYEKTMNVARNFMYLVPELADELRSRVGAEVQAALTEYNDIEPYWFVSKYDRTYAEGVYQPLYDYNALFLAKAYILEEPYDELVKYLDVSAFYRGDLFYIQDLVAALTVGGDSLGFALYVSPGSQSVQAGDTATYTIQIQHSPTFTYTVILEVGPSPSPDDLAVALASPTTFDPPGGQTTLTLTDRHAAPFTETVWYTVPITATGGDIVRTTSVALFVNGKQVFLPIVVK
jgi:hypothetical protein